jgi:transcriptional regulator with PAS, ATPase and Fis domain
MAIALEKLSALDPRPPECGGAFENSPRMRAIGEVIEQVAATDVTVLVRGETGVGKELVARAIHDGSPRRECTLVKINCAAMPLHLLESELFGYERGAFTGADRCKPGKFEIAEGGSIHLDEIGEMPMALQAKLLHVLQDGTFARLGGRRDIKVDARVVVSTNRDLETAMTQGLFREDLYYRLNVVSIHVPPLRERPEEIPFLAERFRERAAQRYGRQRTHLSRELLERFMAHLWPGNVRELENLVTRIVVLRSEETVLSQLQPRTAAAESGLGLKEIGRRAARAAEYLVLKHVLEEVRWNRVEAAKLLKISYKTLLYKIQMHDW